MALYTTTKEFDKITGGRVISVQANAGSVLLQVKHADGVYLDVEDFTADAVKVLEFGIGRTYKFTVTGAATYAM